MGLSTQVCDRSSCYGVTKQWERPAMALAYVAAYVEHQSPSTAPEERRRTLIAISCICRGLRIALLPRIFQPLVIQETTPIGSFSIDHSLLRSKLQQLALSGVLFKEDTLAILSELPNLSVLSLLDVTFSLPPEEDAMPRKPLRLATLTVMSPRRAMPGLGVLVAIASTPSLNSVTTNNGELVSCLRDLGFHGCPRLQSFTFHSTDSDSSPPPLAAFLQHPMCNTLLHLKLLGEIRPATELSGSDLPNLSTLVAPASWAVALVPGRHIRRLHILPSYNPSAEGIRHALDASLTSITDLSIPYRACSSRTSGLLFNSERLSRLNTLQVYTTMSLPRDQADQCRTSFGLIQQATQYWEEVLSLLEACQLDQMQHLSLRLNHVHGTVSYHLQAQFNTLRRLLGHTTLSTVDFTDGVIWERYGSTWMPWIQGHQRLRIREEVSNVLHAKGFKAHMSLISDVDDCLSGLFDGDKQVEALLLARSSG